MTMWMMSQNIFNPEWKEKQVKEEIKIKSKNYDFMNANGIIIIPCETEKFDEIIESVRVIIKDHDQIKVTDKILDEYFAEFLSFK